MNLSVRTCYSLKRFGINTLNDFKGMSIETLQSIENLEKQRVDEILLKLEEYGFSLNERNEIESIEEIEKHKELIEQELKKGYPINEELLKEICINYGNINNFISLYRTGKLPKYEMKKYNNLLVNNMIDIDLNPNGENYRALLERLFSYDDPSLKIHEGDLKFYSSKKIDEILKNLEPLETEILNLKDGKIKTDKEVGDILDI